MINNRQGGRRRGRGGQRPPNVGGQPGNRQDNRQRGNAAQLLEKYKSLARDSQLAGDRVQTEYYLQYADHYFRVLNESRSRFEEQRRQRGDDLDDDDEGEELMDAEGEGSEEAERPERQERAERPERQERPDRAERPERQPREERGARRRFREDRPDDRRPERRDEQLDAANGEEQPNGSGPGIALDALPPAIGAADPSVGSEEAEAKPRRRTRRPRAADGDGDVAPAA